MKSWLAFAVMILFVLSSTVPLAHSQASGGVSASLQNGVWTVPVNKQVQIAADLTSGLDTDQPFAYIVQVQDKNGVTIQLSWLTGTLSAGQTLSPSQSWTPTVPGNYTAQIFVWSAINNPEALSPVLTMKITVT
jgi:hypothetical protein